MARSSYLGSDLPDEQLRMPARGPALGAGPPRTSGAEAAGPNFMNMGVYSEGPGARPPNMGDGGGANTADVGGEVEVVAAHDLLTRRAQEYMGMSPEEAGDMPVERLVQMLLEAYPDDQELARAAEIVTAEWGAATPGRTKQGEPGVMAGPEEPGAVGMGAESAMQFRPDRPY